MKIFIESIDQRIWDSIENDPNIPKFKKDNSFIVYRPGHQVWWRGLHVTMWGVLSGAREQGKDGWFRGGRSRRFMELAFCDEHGRLSPGLSVIDVFGDWRSGSLISPQEARRRISRQAQSKLMKGPKSVSSSVQLQWGDCRASIGREGCVGWRGQLAYQRQDSQSGHSLVAGFPQPEHAWRSDKEGAISDKRYHRHGALCCTRYSPCRVVFQSILRVTLPHG